MVQLPEFSTLLRLSTEIGMPRLITAVLLREPKEILSLNTRCLKISSPLDAMIAQSNGIQVKVAICGDRSGPKGRDPH